MRGSQCSPWERMTGSHLQTGACTGSLLMAIWGCTRGYKREVHTGGLRAIMALLLATCLDPHQSIYGDKSCISMCKDMHPHTYHPITLLQCPSNKQTHRLRMTRNIDPWHQLPPQPQHVNASCDATLQPHYCGRSLSLAAQHNYSPDEWFGNDRQLDLQTVRYWGAHFLPAWVPEV